MEDASNNAKKIENATVTTSIHIANKSDLYSAYMPFIKNGGLFIATNKEFYLGDQIALNLILLDEPEVNALEGVVVWVTPIGAQGGLPAGIGVQFPEDQGQELRKKIDTYLAGSSTSEKRTDTM